MTRVSVVIRVKNDAPNLMKAVATVRRTEPDSEVIIVDNVSNDDTNTVAALIGDKVLRRAGSVGDCLRPGVEHASSAVVFFMDADQRVLERTIADACAALIGHEAVIVPERPSVKTSLWDSVLAAERIWSEVSGLGRPRVFWRDVYLTYKEPSGISFGEDAMIAAQVKDVTISAIPILHEEPGSLVKVLRKYYQYGQRHSGTRGSVDNLPRAAWSYIKGMRQLPVNTLLFVPAVILLKTAKACAFYGGVVRARV